MIRKDRTYLLAYVLVSLMSVSGAFLVSLHFLKHAKAQAGEPPPQDSPDNLPAPLPPSAASESGEPLTANPNPGNNNPPPAPRPSDPASAQPAAQAPSTAQAPPQPPQPPPAPTGTSAPTTQSGAVPQAGINELEGFLEPFIYDIVNRRDPFQPYAEYVPSSTPDDTGPPRALSPAQRWDLEQLKLIGIMWDIKDPKAMFLDPEEDVMILGRDESIGSHNGYVATIREGEVVVVEAIRKRGDIIYRTRVLRIER